MFALGALTRVMFFTVITYSVIDLVRTRRVLPCLFAIFLFGPWLVGFNRLLQYAYLEQGAPMSVQSFILYIFWSGAVFLGSIAVKNVRGVRLRTKS